MNQKLSKKFKIIIIILALLIIAKYTILQNRDFKIAKTKLTNKIFELSYLWKKDFIKEEKTSFCIISPTYKAGNYGILSAESVLNQKYSNWHLHIIDDNSPDNSHEILKEYLAKQTHNGKITLEKNSTNVGALANYMKIKKYCNDEEVVIILDGDDYLFSKHTLSILNHEYVKNDYWMIFSRYISLANGFKSTKGFYSEKDINENLFRSYSFNFGHIRSFKAWLFNKINLNDLKDSEGHFYRTSTDSVIYYPMAEMTPFSKIKKLTNPIFHAYNNIRNDNVYKVNGAKQRQVFCETIVKPRYGKIKSKNSKPEYMLPVDNYEKELLELCTPEIKNFKNAL